MGIMGFSSEASEAVRVRCKQAASAIARTSSTQRGQATQTRDTPQGVGVLGLGDQTHAIAQEPFDTCSQAKGFIRDSDREWSRQHASVVACSAIDPLAKSCPTCGGYCVATELDVHLIERSQFDSAKALLYNINHAMKDLYSALGRHLSKELKHPILLVRIVLPDDTVAPHQAGWLLTRAAFRPRQVDGIRLDIQEGMQAPFNVVLSTRNVPGTEMRLFNLCELPEIAMEIACLQTQYDSGMLEYAYNPSYVPDWRNSMRTLQVRDPPTWIRPGRLDLGDDSDQSGGPDGDGGDDDDGNDDELGELGELVTSLTGKAAPANRKRRTRQPAKPRPSDDRGRGAGPGV